MNRRSVASEVRVPNHEETIAPVSIFDGQGRLVRVVPATEFRRTPMVRARSFTGRRRNPAAGRTHATTASDQPPGIAQ